VKKRKVIFDTEMNGLHRPTKIWCAVLIDINTNEVFKFRPNSPLSGHVDWAQEFIDFVEAEVETFVGHNLIGYDKPHTNRILGKEILKLENLEDTLVMSRLANPTRLGGHSLENWGRITGQRKIDFDDFSKFSEEQLEYCVGDCLTNLKTYYHILEELIGFSPESIRLEHDVASLLHQQEQNGFHLDLVKATALKDRTKCELESMDYELQNLFPPKFKLVRYYEPKMTKKGEMGKVSSRILDFYKTNENCKAELTEDGQGYNLYVKEVFNAQSPKQIAERLLDLGWSPKRYTDKGNIKTDKETMSEAILELLAAKPHLEAIRALSKYNIVADRHQKASKWLELAFKEEFDKDGRVHGRVNPIGAGTHRCSHYDDNMANIARVVPADLSEEDFIRQTGVDPANAVRFQRINDIVFIGKNPKNNTVHCALAGLQGAYGWDSRDCWSVPDPTKQILVGADASGIQLRALAHYMADKDYTKALIEGDIHTVHQKAAGIATRNKAKTFIYAWLLGAGDEKIGSIVGVTEEEFDGLFAWAKVIQKWGKSLLEITINNLRNKGRKADKRTVATILKGAQTREMFLNRTPALKNLRLVEIPKATKQGYLVGLDGRKLHIPNEHLAMSLYLQGFEAVIMKKAMQLYSKELDILQIPFKQVAMIHDEYQVETLIEHGTIVGQTIVNSIIKAGEHFGTNCPLDGEYKLGQTWAQTH